MEDGKRWSTGLYDVISFATHVTKICHLFREEQPVDLELPAVPEPLYVPSAAPEVPEKKFKEKTISHIPADEKSALNDTFFKKRKVNRNARQRLDVD